MRQGARGGGVAILQAALIDLGYPMPVSTRKTGIPDGVYGRETKAKVIAFQAKQSLVKDGIAARRTFNRLDAVMMKKTSMPLPKPAPPPPLPTSRDYKIGTTDPTIRPDPGAGAWNSVATTMTARVQKQLILEILPPRSASAALVIGDDAAHHLKHYMDNTERKLTIDLEGMIEEVRTAKMRFHNEVNQAKAFVEQLAVGEHRITSKMAEGARNRKSENGNWFFAIGGYSTWGKGLARVKKDASGRREYELDFEYKFFDRYNWDGGKAAEIFGITITDQFMGEFHRQGLAREYDCVGSIKRKLRWKDGEAIPAQQLLPASKR
nr:peptidoglycan-binding domain-containing protein [Candidatus Thiosymbion oneisti]